MIPAHQPTTLPLPFFVATSSSANGSIRHPGADAGAAKTIAKWCQALHVPVEYTVGMLLTYGDGRTYTDIVELDAVPSVHGAASKDGWLEADAFVTDAPSIAMLLPVGDCNAVVYADPVRHVMALAHLGWHSTVRDLAKKVVEYMHTRYGSEPSDILIYNSPSVRAQSYRFAYLEQTELTRWHAEPYAVRQPDGRYAIDLLQYNRDQWAEAGVRSENIEVVDVDTATSEQYPSHSTGQRERFAVLAMMAK